MTKRHLFSSLSAGFTVIELLVVVTIMIMLTAVGLVSYQQLGQRARNSRRQSDMETVRQALVLYRTEVGTYPTPSGNGQAAFLALMGDATFNTYLSGTTIEDPKGQGDPTYYYEYYTSGGYYYVRARKEPANPATYHAVRLP